MSFIDVLFNPFRSKSRSSPTPTPIRTSRAGREKIPGQPTITVGSVGLNEDFIAAYRQKGAQTAGIERLLEMPERGDCDLVAVGHAPIVNADWPNTVRAGQFDRLAAFDPKVLETQA